MRKLLSAILISFILAFAATGALFANGQSESSGKKSKGNVTLVYVEWARAVAITHVAATILRQQGYNVETDSVANAAMWAAVGTGNADALLCAWLPKTHAALFAKYKNSVIDVGPNYTGAKLGLTVPDYVTINSITQLKANIKKFNGKIIGIDPGAGEMEATQKAIKNNVDGLGAFDLVPGSGATMTAALGTAIKNHKWIVVTGWKPHWMFGRWHLKILKDPANIYGKAEHIDTVVTKDLPSKKPGVYKFLKNFNWQKVDLSPVLLNDKNGMNPRKAAEKFVAAHKSLIDSLLAKTGTNFALSSSSSRS